MHHLHRPVGMLRRWWLHSALSKSLYLKKPRRRMINAIEQQHPPGIANLGQNLHGIELQGIPLENF